MRLLGRIASIASLAGVAVLVAFHGWLFALRLVEGRLAEPGVALRWLAAAVLLLALGALRRAGVPIVRGRKALVFWALVVLLHGTAAPAPDRGVEVEQLILALPATVLTMGLLGGLVRALIGAIATPRAPRLPASRLCRAPALLFGGPFLPLLAARPPPA